MESLFLLVPVALVFCAVAIRLLLWAIDSGQYDDLDKEGFRILTDEDEDKDKDKDKDSDRNPPQDSAP